MKTENSGYIVETKSGKLGRTYHSKGIINGKIPVYLATTIKETILPAGESIKVACAFSDNAILCDPKGLKQIGFID